MLRLPTTIIVGLLVCARLVAGGEVDRKLPSLESLFSEVITFHDGQATTALEAIASKIREAGDDKDRRAAIERHLLLILNSEASLDAKRHVCELLSCIASAEAVPTLAAMLDGADTSLMARYVLQRMDAPEATAALRDALPRLTGMLRVGVVNSLGALRDRQSTAALVEMIGDPNSSVAAAALAALGRIGGPEAAQALAAANVPKTLRRAAADAYLACAEQLAAGGKGNEAQAIYRTLNTDAQSRAVRRAAQHGLLNTGGKEAAAMILAMLADENADARAAATPHITKLVGTDAMKDMIAALPNLSPPAQTVLLGALAASGDKSAGPAALAAMKGNDLGVRLAAIRAVGILCDARAVPALIGALRTRGEEGETARRSLCSLSGEGADEAIMTALREAPVELQAALIDVLVARKVRIAVPLFMRHAMDANGEIRSRAVAALRELAGPDDVPELIEVLVNTPPGRPRDEMAKVIVFACQRLDDPSRRAEPVLAVLAHAAAPRRCLLLPLVGRLGGTKSLEIVHAAMTDGDPAVHEAGVRGLCNWPDAGVAAELYELAQNAKKPTHRVWALRAYIRVVTLPSDRPRLESLTMLKSAMKLASRDEERNLVLSRAAAVRDIETLRFVSPYLDAPPLAADAARAVVELAHHRELFAPNRDEFIKALMKVLDVCKDPMVLDRARRYLGGP